MKVKIFEAVNKDILEFDMNTWLSSHGFRVARISHSTSSGHGYSALVLYDETTLI